MEPQNQDKFLPKGKIKPGRPGPMNNERMSKKKSFKKKLEMMAKELVEGPDLGRPPKTSAPKGHRPPRNFVRNDSREKFPEFEWRNGYSTKRPGPRPWNGDRGRPLNFPGSLPGSPERRSDVGRGRMNMRFGMGPPSPENFVGSGHPLRSPSSGWCDDGSRFPGQLGRIRMMNISRSPTPEHFGPPRMPSPEYIGPPRRPSSEHFSPPRRPSPEHIGPPRRPHPEHFGPPTRPSPEHIGPPRRPHPEHFGPLRRPSPEHIGSPRRPHPEHFGPPTRPSPEHICPPRRPHPEHFSPPRRPSPEHIGSPRRPHLEHFGPARRPSSEHFSPPRRPSPEHIGPPRRPHPEHFSPPRRPSPEHITPPRRPHPELSPRRPHPEHFGPPRRPSPEHIGSPRRPHPEHFGPPTRPSPEYIGPQRRPHPVHFSPSRRPSPDHIGSPRRPHPEHFGPPTRPSPEHFSRLRRPSPDQFGLMPSERFDPRRGPSPEHFGSPWGLSSGHLGLQRGMSPEDFSSLQGTSFVNIAPPRRAQPKHFSPSRRPSPENVEPPRWLSPDYFRPPLGSSPEQLGPSQRPPPGHFGSSKRPSPMREDQWNSRFPGPHPPSPDIDDRPRMNRKFDQKPRLPENYPDRPDSRNERSPGNEKWARYSGPERYSHSPEPHHSIHGSSVQDIDERHFGFIPNPVQMELSSSRSPSPAKGAPPQTETSQHTYAPDNDKDTKGSNCQSQPQIFLPGNPIPPTNPMEMMMACQASTWFPPMAMPGFGAYPYYAMGGQQQVQSQTFGWANYYYVGQPTLPMVPPLPETPIPQNPPAPPESPVKQAKQNQEQPRQEKPKPEQLKRKTDTVQEQPKQKFEPAQEQPKRMPESMQEQPPRKSEQKHKGLVRKLSKKTITRPWILLNDESSQESKEIVLRGDSDSDQSSDQDSVSSSREDSVKQEVNTNFSEREMKNQSLEKVRANVSVEEEFIDDFDREKLILESLKVKKVGLNRENRVVFVPWNYPEASLSTEQANELAGQLVSKLDSIKLGSDFEPTFESYFVNRGAFVLNCGNEATKVWTKQLATDLSLTGVTLLIATGPDIPTLNVKVGGFFPGEKLASSLVLSILRNENPRLLIEKWSLVEQITKRDGFFAIMKIPKALIPELEADDFRVRYNKHQVILKLFSDNNLEGEGHQKSPFDIQPVPSEHRRSNLPLKNCRGSVNTHYIKRRSKSPRRIPRHLEMRKKIVSSRQRRARSPRQRLSFPRRWM